jgi:hypothetical protein
MTMPPRYTEFGYPLNELPLPGHPVDSLDVLNTALVKQDLTIENGSAALGLLEGHLETALHILKRWEETRAKRPTSPGGREA